MTTKTIQHLIGNPKGHYNDKFNRAAKLYARFDELLDKMDGFLSVQSVTHRTECALAIKLMLLTGIRIGNEGSAEGYVSKRKDVGHVQTFGLTTLQTEHITVSKTKVAINFTGKRCIDQSIAIADKKLAAQIKKVHEHNSELGTFLSISDSDLRRFVRTSVGNQFMPKDFRTLRANMEATQYIKTRILTRDLPRTKREMNAEIKEVTEHVASVLGNTPSICKKSYINAEIFDYLMDERWYN